MDWIAEHLKLIIFVIIIAVYALKAMRAKSETDQNEQGQPARRMPGEQDPAEAERTRQIQEEIRRRILARQRGEAPSPEGPVVIEEAPPPLPPPLPVPQPVRPVDDPYRDEIEEERAARDAGVLEAQRALEEQLRHAKRLREMATAGVPSFSIGSPVRSGGARASATRRALHEDLRGRGSLRRAIVLREVLGEPVALRTGPAGMTRR